MTEWRCSAATSRPATRPRTRRPGEGARTTRRLTSPARAHRDDCDAGRGAGHSPVRRAPASSATRDGARRGQERGEDGVEAEGGGEGGARWLGPGGSRIAEMAGQRERDACVVGEREAVGPAIAEAARPARPAHNHRNPSPPTRAVRAANPAASASQVCPCGAGRVLTERLSRGVARPWRRRCRRAALRVWR